MNIFDQEDDGPTFSSFSKSEIAEFKRALDQIKPLMKEYRRPIVIEFAGSPKSGKSTIISAFSLFLRRNNVSTHVVTERASMCPIDRKDHMTFNAWTICTSLSQLLEHTNSNSQVVILDRGLFDSLCWMDWMRMTGRIDEEEQKTITDFVTLARWRNLIDLTFVMKVSTEESLRREYTNSPTEAFGTVMKPVTLNLFDTAISNTIKAYDKTFKRIVQIDTTDQEPRESVTAVINSAIEMFEETVDEEVLAIDESRLSFVVPGLTKSAEIFAKVLKLAETNGKFVKRSIAENDNSLVQIIPVAIFTSANNLFLLRRKESDERDRMHNKYVVWAGGHARSDDELGDLGVILTALRRELDEELYIKSKYTETQLGLVFDSSNPKSKRHLGIVYSIEIQDENITLAMDQNEFKERRGQGLSGTFIDPNNFPPNIKSRDIEPWSKFILAAEYGLQFDLPPMQKSLFQS